MTVLSLDASTRCVGYVLMDNTTLLEANAIDLSQKKDLLDKANQVKNTLAPLALSADCVVIERFLLFFQKGKSSAHAITKLAHFSGMLAWMFFETTGKKVRYVHHSSALSACGLTTKPDSFRKRKKTISTDQKLSDREYIYALRKKFSSMFSPSVLRKARPSKLKAFEFFMDKNPNFKMFLDRHGQATEQNFDIADAFINGYFYIHFLADEDSVDQDTIENTTSSDH